MSSKNIGKKLKLSSGSLYLLAIKGSSSVLIGDSGFRAFLEIKSIAPLESLILFRIFCFQGLLNSISSSSMRISKSRYVFIDLNSATSNESFLEYEINTL